MIDVEERLRRAGSALDDAAGARSVADRAYAAPLRTHARRRALAGVLAVAAAAAGVLGLSRARQDPVTATVPRPPAGAEGWFSLPDAPIGPRFQQLALWTDRGLLVWGGYADHDRSDGALYDPSSGTWRTLPAAPLQRGRGDAIGVWNGAEAIVLNGIDGARAAAFDPASFSWRALPDPPLHNAANAMNRVLLVGDTVVVVGVADEQDGRAPTQVARFDAATSTWSTGATPPVEFTSFFDAVSTGSEVIVVAGRASNGDKSCGSVVLAYNPASDTWRELPWGDSEQLTSPVVVWTGAELFVGGGRVCGTSGEPSRRARLLEPAAGTWRAAPDAPLPIAGNDRYEEIWTGAAVLTLTGDQTPVLFNPASGQWHVGTRSTIDARRTETPWVWDGAELLVWSGGGAVGSGCCDPIDRGEAYVPPPAFVATR